MHTPTQYCKYDVGTTIPPDDLREDISAESDFELRNEGTIFLLRPISEAGNAWLSENVHAEDYQYFGGALAVEHRYIDDIVAGIAADGLRVS
jgi:hypothetical protein